MALHVPVVGGWHTLEPLCHGDAYGPLIGHGTSVTFLPAADAADAKACASYRLSGLIGGGGGEGAGGGMRGWWWWCPRM